MNGTRRYKAHKHTVKCPQTNCNYTSRIPNDETFLTNKNSSHSKICPKHRVELQKFYLPLKNKKSRNKVQTISLAEIKRRLENKLNKL